jgi:hypothetical protein
MQLVGYIVLGLFLAAPGEVLNQLLARQNPLAFVHTLLSYSVLLLAGFFVGKGLDRILKSRAISLLTFYLLFGALGLAVEWFLLGNAPVLDPLQLVVQPGMFTYWGTMLLGPRLLMERGPRYSRLKRSFVRYFVAFSALYLVVAAVIPRAMGGIFFGFLLFAAGSVALNCYYGKYFGKVRRADRTDKAPDVP